MARQRESHSHLRRYQAASECIGPCMETLSLRDRTNGLTCVKIDHRNGTHAGSATNGWLRKRFGSGWFDAPCRENGPCRGASARRGAPEMAVFPGRTSTAPWPRDGPRPACAGLRPGKGGTGLPSGAAQSSVRIDALQPCPVRLTDRCSRRVPAPAQMDRQHRQPDRGKQERARPQQDRAAPQRRAVEHEVPVAGDHERGDLVLAPAVLHHAVHLAAQIRSKVGVRLRDGLVLAYETPELVHQRVIPLLVLGSSRIREARKRSARARWRITKNESRR